MTGRRRAKEITTAARLEIVLMYPEIPIDKGGHMIAKVVVTQERPLPIETIKEEKEDLMIIQEEGRDQEIKRKGGSNRIAPGLPLPFLRSHLNITSRMRTEGLDDDVLDSTLLI